MYLFFVDIIINGVTQSEEIWADNTREAIEIAELNYPNAFIKI